MYNIAMLNNSIDTLKGIGAKSLEAFNSYGIYSIRDLLYHFPYKYKDIEKKDYIKDVHHEQELIAEVRVITKPSLRRIRGGLSIVQFNVSDSISSVKCIYYNQPYMAKNINIDDEFMIIGKIEQKGNLKQIINAQIIKIDDTIPKILTYYRLPKGVNQKKFIKILKSTFEMCNNQIDEPIPSKLRIKHNLAEVNYAIEQMHFPKNMQSVKQASYRLAFEEMFFFILILRMIKKSNKDKRGTRQTISDRKLNEFLDQLPFTLTNAQKKVVKTIRSDMAGNKVGNYVMNRMLQGDVGSGKTVVAMVALYISVCSSYQGVMMAPTEVLAQQHYKDFKDVFDRFGVNVKLLTASMKAKEKRELLHDLKTGDIDIVVGTHALIQKTVEFKALGIAITDEQHRFGVNQRAILSQKGENPHMLVMSATPVPRSLALLLYGDLDVSIIDELPPGKLKVETRLVTKNKRKAMYEYLRDALRADDQAYIVCPMIEESEKLNVLSVTQLYEELKANELKNIEIGLLHGRMKDKDKIELLNRFSNGEIKALISTTVIEVGVNVRSATIMIIENAERFGLAQLHQLRGRVGRGTKKSWCFMTSESKNETSLERLKIMTATNDGFVIAEKDLELRGPGEFLGLRQSGLLDRRVLMLMNDVRLISDVKEAIDEMLNGVYGDVSDDIYRLVIKRYENKIENIVLN